MNRLFNLDYLRGLAALGIMVYHYFSWGVGAFTSETFLGRIGLYGVALFYVLSGLTLYHVYKERMQPSAPELFNFARKRFFRIFPLLWLATIATVLFSNQLLDVEKLLLNLSGLFGLFAWEEYYALGAWSIGNELVFYLFFPLFMLLYNRSKAGLAVLALGVAALYFYFAFYALTSNQPLSDQWNIYINPLNQLFLFMGGFLLGVLFGKTQMGNGPALLLIFAGIALLAFYPVAGNLIGLITGSNRLVFTASCFMICLGFYKVQLRLPQVLHQPLRLLGEASYSVYLLHPLVYDVLIGDAFPAISANFVAISISYRIAGAILITLLLSYGVYESLEKYFIRLGSKIGAANSLVLPVNKSRSLE